MKNLPNEVKIDIFKCLNFCQLNKARLLNKQFCALIDEFAGKLARKREVNRPPLTRRCGRCFGSFTGGPVVCHLSSNFLTWDVGNNRICKNCGRSLQSGSNFEFDGGGAYM